MPQMFDNCKSLISLDISNFNTENVIYMYGIFGSYESLFSFNVSNFNTNKMNSIMCIFEIVILFSLDISNFITKNVK